jgi:hypothetical protein
MISLIAWNSQMALDARHHLFYHDAEPKNLWKVTNDEDKEFVLKLYEVTEGTNAVETGKYIESVYLGDSNDYDPTAPESGTEWAYLETSMDSFLNHYKTVDQLKVNQ